MVLIRLQTLTAAAKRTPELSSPKIPYELLQECGNGLPPIFVQVNNPVHVCRRPQYEEANQQRQRRGLKAPPSLDAYRTV